MINLETTIRGCIKKDRKAQEEFFKYFYGRLMSVSCRVSPNDNIANDILQDSFLKILDKLHMLDNFNEAVVYSWCKRIVTNTAIDFYRSEKPFMNHMEILDIPEDWVDRSLDWKIQPEKFTGERYGGGKYGNIEPETALKAIQNLSPQYKLVFNMYIFDGYSHEDIAKELNISVNTSKANLSKAKANLRNILTPKLEEC
jgi:RNA polymerase sigma-70 factor (ECF subfamily)